MDMHMHIRCISWCILAYNWLGLDGDGVHGIQGLVFYTLRSAKCKSFVGKGLSATCKVHVLCRLCAPYDL